MLPLFIGLCPVHKSLAYEQFLAPPSLEEACRYGSCDEHLVIYQRHTNTTEEKDA